MVAGRPTARMPTAQRRSDAPAGGVAMDSFAEVRTAGWSDARVGPIERRRARELPKGDIPSTELERKILHLHFTCKFTVNLP